MYGLMGGIRSASNRAPNGLTVRSPFRVTRADGTGFLRAGETAGRAYFSLNFVPGSETPIAGSENVLIVAQRSDSAVMIDLGLTVTGVGNDSAAIRPQIAQTSAATGTLIQAVEVHTTRNAIATGGTTWGMGVNLHDETGGSSGASGYNESAILRLSSEPHGVASPAVRAQSAIWITGGNNSDDTAGGVRHFIYAEENGVAKLDITKDGVAILGVLPATIGQIRLPNATIIAARNAANNGNIPLIQSDASNNIIIGAVATVAQAYVTVGTAINLQVGVNTELSATTLGLVLGRAASQVGFFASAGVAKQSIAAAASDPTTTQALANSIRTILLAHGLVA